MEIKVGDYGRMIFEQCLQVHGTSLPEHWESIREEATPLVKQLLALNKKMTRRPGIEPYKIIGYVDDSGKKILSDWDRIDLARRKLWGTTVKELDKGDRFFVLDHDDFDMDFHEGPTSIEYRKKDCVGVELSAFRVVKLRMHTKVLRVPPDWDEKEEIYCSDKYWLAEADKLGI